MAANVTVAVALSHFSSSVERVPDWAAALLSLVSVVVFFCCAQTTVLCCFVPFIFSRGHQALALADPPQEPPPCPAPASRPGDIYDMEL